MVIPAKNEEDIIAETVNRFYQTAADVMADFEIIMINDGSSDRTGRIMDDLAQTCPEKISVHHHSCSRGLGAVFETAINLARFDDLILIPGDLAYHPEGLAALLSAVGSADYVIGRRTNYRQTVSFSRFCISRLYKFILHVLFPIGLSDFHGIPVYPLRYLKEMDLHLRGYAFQLEILVKFHRKGLSRKEVPIVMNVNKGRHSQSLRMATLADIAGMIWHLFTHRDHKKETSGG